MNSYLLRLTGYDPQLKVAWHRYERIEAETAADAIHFAIVRFKDESIEDIRPWRGGDPTWTARITCEAQEPRPWTWAKD